MTRLVALLLTVMTGFSGLVYEVAWQRYLATLLGSHSEATAAVLGLFLGGLAVGYSLFGRVTGRIVSRARAAGRPPRLLRVYGLVEGAIGVYALVFPILFQAVQGISFLVPLGIGAVSFAFDVVLSALLIVPPAILMGGTIPVLTQALARSLDDATRFHALVYAFNTAGAFAGALAAGFWLVPALGLVGVLVAMGVVNLFAGAVFIALDRRLRSELVLPVGEAEGDRGSRIEGFFTFAAIALLVGFAMMAVQTVLIRLGGLAFGSSQFTFSMVVAVFVLCIALGSFAVSTLPRIPKSLLVFGLWALVGALFLMYPMLPDAPYWAHVLRSLFRSVDAAFYPYYLAAFATVLVVIGPAVVLSGAVLPLLFHHLRQEYGALGDAAGRLYSWNTVGSLLGALLGGYALLFWLDLHHVFRLAMVGAAVAAVAATARLYEIGRGPAAVFVLGPVVAAVSLLSTWDPVRLSSGLFRNRAPTTITYLGPDVLFAKGELPEVLFYVDDPTTSVAVQRWQRDPTGVGLSIVNNGKSDGAVPDDYVTMGFAGLLPALLADEPERAFVIGYGTGVTAGELAALRSVQEVVVAEISRGVIEAAPFFDPSNLQASQNSKVHMLRGDAYRALLKSEGRFDVIVSEPSNPWVTGVEMLFSREFLEAARDRLAPGGVYAQWFHTYETDTATIAMVLRTYASVFDHVAVWYAQGDDLILLGLTDSDAALDVDRLAARMSRPDYKAGLARTGIHSLEELLAHERLPLGVIHATPLPGEPHTLLHPRLSHLAARAFFAGIHGKVPVTAGLEAARVGGRNSLMARYIERSGGSLSEPARIRFVEETCLYWPLGCVTLLAQWAHEVPDSPDRRRIEQQLRGNDLISAATEFDLVQSLSRFYDEPLSIDKAKPMTAAKAATNRFTEYYHHGAPFRRQALAEVWRRCALDPAQRDSCGRARDQLERVLGDLEVEVGRAGASQPARGG